MSDTRTPPPRSVGSLTPERAPTPELAPESADPMKDRMDDIAEIASLLPDSDTVAWVTPADGDAFPVLGGELFCVLALMPAVYDRAAEERTDAILRIWRLFTTSHRGLHPVVVDAAVRTAATLTRDDAAALDTAVFGSAAFGVPEGLVDVAGVLKSVVSDFMFTATTKRRRVSVSDTDEDDDESDKRQKTDGDPPGIFAQAVWKRLGSIDDALAALTARIEGMNATSTGTAHAVSALSETVKDAMKRVNTRPPPLVPCSPQAVFPRQPVFPPPARPPVFPPPMRQPTAVWDGTTWVMTF